MFLAALFIFLFPRNEIIHTEAGDFILKLCPARCAAPVKTKLFRLDVKEAYAYTNCVSKVVRVSSDVPANIQAKALIHEFVHVGLTCDTRIGDKEEHAAEAVNALFNNNAAATFIQGAK